MTKKIASFSLILVLFVLTGCAGVGSIGGSYIPGGIFSNAKMPVGATGANGVKEGTACADSILGLVAIGDASVQAAMADGGITQVSSVDVRVKNILNLYATYCTVVRGK